MTKSPRKNVPDVGIELGAACMPSELASEWATAPGICVCAFQWERVIFEKNNAQLHVTLCFKNVLTGVMWNEKPDKNVKFWELFLRTLKYFMDFAYAVKNIEDLVNEWYSACFWILCMLQLSDRFSR